MSRRLRPILALALLAACATDPVPDGSPGPTTYPTDPHDVAVALVASYLDAWAAADYEAMYASLDPILQERYPLERFVALHATFAEMAEVSALTATTGDPRIIGLPPEPRPDAFPAPSPAPLPSGSPSASPASSDPDEVLSGPVPGLAVPVELAVASDRFGALDLDRELAMVHGVDGWLLRWSPEALFPELGADGTLRLDRSLGARGRVIGPDGLVWAETREDGIRVYPQESLGGQVIGYVSEVTAEDLELLEGDGYRAEDLIGRSGLESGAEALLRGIPGWTLSAVDGDGVASVLYETEMVPGADVEITLRPSIQAAAQQTLVPYAQAATAVVDPETGDVWALASAPAFNPNSMTLGTTLTGEPLNAAGTGQIFNKATVAAYPAGSSFKPFTLAAALQTGTVTPESPVTCPATWQYNPSFTVRNYMDHQLPGQVTLAEAMAFSCNTTYMPLAYEVYLREETALTDLLFEFGFGAPTGMSYLAEEGGIVPDGDWLAANGRGGYSGFEQIQLAIGQGAFLGTPLQLANAYAAIGNGGTLWVPRIVTAATLPDGTVVEVIQPTVAQEISVSAADLAYVTDTLVAVTTLSYGTGTSAFAGFGIPVAGKSGTAETGGPDPHAWFAAFAPADAPTISVATVLPTIPLGTGGSDAAPLVRAVIAAHLAE